MRSTGKVSISGFEEWTIGDDGLLAASLGHFDQADWDSQVLRRRSQQAEPG